MVEHLVFTLAATMVSFGDVAGHERRGSWSWPGRSAILGLLAAAQGIRRDGDFAALDRLSVAVAVFEAGAPLRDFHTVQTVPTAAVRHPQARPEALSRAGGSINTTITLRDYRQGALFGIAVTGPDLAVLAKGLERPAFHLYLGRKSCPLSAPLAPRLVKADSPEVALTALTLPPWHTGATARLLYAEDGPAQRIEMRNDTPRDRLKWHFAPRAVHVRAVEIAPGAAA